MKRSSLFVCLGLAGALGTIPGCKTDPNDVCDPGALDMCDCPGESGLTMCALDGSEWIDCDCPPGPTNAPPVTVGSLMWQTTLGPSLQPSEAAAYCENETEDFTDWRLPTRAEFETFFSGCTDIGNGFIRCTGQCNNASFCTVAPATWYQTATAAGAGKHYTVHTGKGFLAPVSDAFSVSTICVRDATSL